jgi:hypothetical protein
MVNGDAPGLVFHDKKPSRLDFIQALRELQPEKWFARVFLLNDSPHRCFAFSQHWIFPDGSRSGRSI